MGLLRGLCAAGTTLYNRERLKCCRGQARRNLQEGWSNLPSDVLESILTRVSAADCWKGRQVCYSWARAARKVARFEVWINVTALSFRGKLRALSEMRSRQPTPHAHVIFCFKEPFWLDNAVTWLQTLSTKDAPLTPFTLDLSLKSADDCRSSQADLWATQIVSISTELQIRHGVNVCIHLQSASGATTMLPASALQLLAPLLYSIDMYTVPHQQTALSNHTSAVLFSGFTPAHIAALQYCSDGLSALCVSDLHASDAQPVASIAGHMAVIAQLSGLSKLHLSLGGSQDANFEPLSQLSSVQDLALQSPRRGVSCTGILTSSRLTLRHIILTAESWSLDTYTALQQLRHLQKLLIKLYVMSAADGAALARVKATYLHLDLRQCNDTSGLSALSSADPASQIHELTLWGLDDHCCYHLESLPSLQVLTIVNSPRLTGVCTWQHSKVSELKMINCPGITAKGLVHMLNTALPAISKVMCLAGSNTDSINHLQINPHLVHALSCGRNLTYVDLRGVRGLSLAGVQQLRSAFTAIQEHGVAQAKVKLILPCREHFCQPTIKVFDSFYCPTFCQVPDSPSLSRHQIFEWQNADKLGALLFSAWLFCILQFSSGRQAT